MPARGTFGKYTPGKPSPTMYWSLVIFLIAYSIVAGYYAGTQPAGEWRLFSWHPFLMTCGMVGFAGIGAMTKKLGGYTNTKLHAIFSSASVMTSFGGIYAIYKNKEENGYEHLKSSHSLAGAACMALCFMLGAAGSIFLHPDLGIQKTNSTIRLAHKMGSRLTLIFAWVTAFYGLLELAPDNSLLLGAYGIPLLAMVPIVLM